VGGWILFLETINDFIIFFVVYIVGTIILIVVNFKEISAATKAYLKRSKSPQVESQEQITK
jgi:hypothetical protein